MRQVRYKRPKDFVDPFALGKDPESETDERRIRSKEHIERRRSSSPSKRSLQAAESPQLSGSASHVGRMKSVRSQRRTKANVGASHAHEKNDTASSDDAPSLRGEELQAAVEEAVDEEEEDRRLLAHCRRMTRVTIPDTEGGAGQGEGEGPSQFDILAEIRCYLLPRRTALVLTAVTVEGSSVGAAAEIYLSKLSSINEVSVEHMLGNEEVMEAVGEALVNTVEMSICNGESSLLVRVSTEVKQDGAGPADPRLAYGENVIQVQRASDSEVASMMRGEHIRRSPSFAPSVRFI